MKRIALLAALPEEYRPVIRATGGWRRVLRPHLRAFLREDGRTSCLLVETGMGGGRLSACFRTCLDLGFGDLVVSMGFAGGLAPDLHVGDLICGRRFLLWEQRQTGVSGDCLRPDDPALLHRMLSGIRLRLADVVTVEGAADKPELSAALSRRGITPAVLDMESAPLAALSRQHAVPFLSLRAVSDELHSPVDFDPMALCDDSGRVRIPKVMSALAGRPSLGGSFYRCWRCSLRAGRALAGWAAAFLALPSPDSAELTGLVPVIDRLGNPVDS
jgi:adenosylhomocysteine nucleosidase